MRSVVYAAILLILLGGSYWFFSGRYSAGTLVERARRDEIAKVVKDDPDMAAAFRKARDTLPEFLALARAPRPTITHMAVKIGIPAGDDSSEFFWLSPFEPRGGKYTGRINNTPRTVTTVKFGQIVEFAEDEIVDWLYTEGDKMLGNFTACALLKHEPPRSGRGFEKRRRIELRSVNATELAQSCSRLRATQPSL
jgi:uncharacterized protein YegJ (DUF2314 family)